MTSFSVVVSAPVINAMVDRPHEINMLLGNAVLLGHTLAPKAAFRVLNLSRHAFSGFRHCCRRPGIGADHADPRVFGVVHW